MQSATQFSRMPKRKCEECNGTRFLLNHHIKPAVYKKGSHSPIDGDHSVSNRKVLCKKCHQNWHCHQKISRNLGIGKCLFCKRLYYFKICHDKGKFCSTKCDIQYRKKNHKDARFKCEFCHKIFFRKHKSMKRRFCSYSCSAKSRGGN